MDEDKQNNIENKLEVENPNTDFEIQKEESVYEVGKISPEDKDLIKEELMREIEVMETDPELKKEAEDKAKNLGSFAVDKIIEHLVEIAQNKGVVFAINVAKKTNDPFILDTFHDILAKQGYYKNFKK